MYALDFSLYYTSEHELSVASAYLDLALDDGSLVLQYLIPLDPDLAKITVLGAQNQTVQSPSAPESGNSIALAKIVTPFSALFLVILIIVFVCVKLREHAAHIRVPVGSDCRASHHLKRKQEPE